MPRPASGAISPNLIVQTSAAIADDVGLEQLTMAAVANRLRITVPGLYKHVESLQAVRRGIALVGIAELTDRIGFATVGKSGAHAVHALASAYRDYAREFPGRYAASVVAPPEGDIEYTAASNRALRIIVAVLGAYNLDEGDAIDAIRSLRAIMHGFVSLEAAGGFGLPQSVDASYERLIETYILGLTVRKERAAPDGT